MSEKSVERCRDKAFILMMLASGRRFEDIQAIETWCNDGNVKVPVFHQVLTCSVLGRVKLKIVIVHDVLRML